MNRLTLKYELDIDFRLVAITCSLKDYRLCYYINKVTGLNLYKIDDQEMVLDNIPLYFSQYFFEDEHDYVSYYLLSNKGVEGGLLVPEMKVTDFFLLVKNVVDNELLAWQVNQINSLQEVVVATEIDPYKLKSKENLIF